MASYADYLLKNSNIKSKWLVNETCNIQIDNCVDRYLFFYYCITLLMKYLRISNGNAYTDNAHTNYHD